MKRIVFAALVALSLLAVSCSENPAEVVVNTTQTESEWQSVKWVGRVDFYATTSTITEMRKTSTVGDTIIVIKNGVSYKCVPSTANGAIVDCKSIKIKVETTSTANLILVKQIETNSNVETIYKYTNSNVYWEVF